MHYSQGAMWRPLFEQDMTLLQVATGCSHNRCTFCDMYHVPCKVSPMEEIKADIDEIGSEWRVPSRIFLAGGNAFHIETEFLLEVADLVNKRLPQVESIGAFARIEDVGKKTDEELASLLEAGIDLISIGAESGNDEALSFMRKGYTAADIVEQCSRLEKVGMRYGLFYLAGMAGKGKGIESAQKSVEVFSKIHPELLMVHTMCIFDGTPLAAEVESGEFVPASEMEIMQELKELYAAYPHRIRIQAMHFSNVATFDAYVPDSREQIIKLMDNHMANLDEERLSKFRRSIRMI